MITNNVGLLRSWDYTDDLACENCGRNKDLKRVFVKSSNRVKEMCFCNKCWKEIIKKGEIVL